MNPVTTDAPTAEQFEAVACYNCGVSESTALLIGQDDLSGKPGDFQFVSCNHCGLAYQSPRLTVENISAYYDEEYIAHRKETNWGILTWFYKHAMGKHDREKEKLVSRYVGINSGTEVLDVGCGSGSFLQRLRTRHQVNASGVDFKNLTTEAQQKLLDRMKNPTPKDYRLFHQDMALTTVRNVPPVVKEDRL